MFGSLSMLEFVCHRQSHEQTSPLIYVLTISGDSLLITPSKFADVKRACALIHFSLTLKQTKP
jgi:hypothetical protein